MITGQGSTFYNTCKTPVAPRNKEPNELVRLFMLVTEIFEEPVASATNAIEGDATDAGVSMADALRRTRQKVEKAKVELAHITKLKGR